MTNQVIICYNFNKSMLLKYYREVFIMQKFYIYDVSNGIWKETNDEKFTGDIDSVPKKLINKGEKGFSLPEGTLAAEADFDAYEVSYSTCCINAAVRWRLQVSEKQQVVIIIGECCNVRECGNSFDRLIESDFDNFIENEVGNFVFTELDELNGFDGLIPNELNNKNIDRKMEIYRDVHQVSLRLDFAKWSYNAIPAIQEKDGGKQDWTSGELETYVEIPPIVINDAYTILKEFAYKEFGFYPTIPEGVFGVELLKAYTCYPLDVSVFPFLSVLNYSFLQKVLRKSDSNFDLVCEYLDLPKTKGLRKVYHENSRALLFIYIMREKLGITDQNVWQEFYGMKKIYDKDVTVLSIQPNQPLTFKDVKSIYSYNFYWIKGDKNWAKLKRFYEWLSLHAGVQKAGNLICQNMNNWCQEYGDLMNMMDSDNYDIPDEIIKKVKSSGLSVEAHDRLIAINTQLRYKRRYSELDYDFNLTKTELDRETVLDNGKIVVAKRGTDLLKISETLHNCVYSYADKMKNKESCIYTYQNDDNMIACIEVQDHAVVQLYGNYNKRIKGLALSEIKDWALLNKLEFNPM